MARRLQVEIIGDASSLHKALGQAQTSGDKFQQGLAKASRGAIVAFGALAAGAGYAVKAASDLGEQVSKSTVVFGDSATEIQDWAKTTATSIGISQRAALEASGTFGQMLTAMGLAKAPAADMSRAMVQLAADMASFNNASPEATLEALRSGLSGEAEPLRQFGVFLNEAGIKAKAMALGLWDGKGALDASAKAQATYALILEQSKTAQGDFERTSGSLANQQRLLRAQLEDVAAKLGAALLPAMQQFASLLQQATQFASEHTTAVKVAAVALTALGGVILTVGAGVKVYTAAAITARAAVAAWTAAQWLLNVALTANPIGVVIMAIAGLAAGIYLAYTRSETFRNAVHRAWEILRQSPLGQAIAHFRELVNVIQSVVAWIGRIPRKISIDIDLPSLPSWAGGGNQFNPNTDLGRRRAMGGPVSRGLTYLVGERGPELFTPRAEGMIVPNHALRPALAMAGGGSEYHFHFHGPVGSDRDMEDMVRSAMARVLNRQGTTWVAG